MSKRRSSIRGRGPEILFGAPPVVDIEPRQADATLVQAVRSEPAPPHSELVEKQSEDMGDASSLLPPEPDSLAEEDSEEVVHQEAVAVEPAIDEEHGEQPVLEEDLLSTLEIEAALLEEAMAAGGPSEALAAESEPTLEVAMEAHDLIEEVALYEPPPPEIDDVARGVLPPRPSRPNLDLADLEAAATADIQAPDEQVERVVLPERELSAAERERVLAGLEDGRLQKLDSRIDEMYDQVVSQVGENDAIATECYNQLLKARDIVLRRDAARIAQAEYYVEQVRARLKRAAASKEAARKSAWWISIWGVLWFVALTSVLILLNFDWFRQLLMPPNAGNLPVDPEILMSAMVWGGIGGVTAVFYSLFKHVSHRDFDSQYSLSYVGKPFLGIILGATVYMVVRLLVLALGIVPIGMLDNETLSSPIIMPWLIYLLAWACGFKENRIFDLVDRVIKQVFGADGTMQ
ncbi:hypothetical protein ACFLYD_01190 [Chloroflexota bacterium]